jgi:quercetin dioxygenase-like cupin family protein
MQETIRVGDMSITFLRSRHETESVLDLFEVTIPPQIDLIVPHLHREYDETVIGMDGITTWTVDGKQTRLRPGEQLFVPRGVVHTWGNRQQSTARMMCILTPGLVGPEYFLEIAAVLNVIGPPDLAQLGTIMTRYGVVPAHTAFSL